MAKRSPKMLTTAQRDALIAYAAENGPRWKSELAVDWSYARAQIAGETSPELQQVRNVFGPGWLHRTTLDQIRSAPTSDGPSNHASPKLSHVGHGYRTTTVRSLDEFYDAIHDMSLTLDGVHGRIKVEKNRHDAYGPCVPSTRVWFVPSKRGRESAVYREEKRRLGDDFDVDLSSSERLFTEVAPKLGVVYE